MSDFRAIATVTATLRRVLLAALPQDVAGATVTTVRPAEGDNASTPDTGVNVFLYQVNPNPQWRNEDLPGRRTDGELAQRPVAALDLYYLLSFYGEEATLEAQQLLGSTVAFLHTQPILPRSEVTAAVAGSAFLAGSDLAQQVDLVRLTPLTMTLEELSRLWSVLLQVKYALSVVYRASIVLLERRVTPQPALPVRDVALAALPLRHPTLRRVIAGSGEDDPITPGADVVLEGDGLAAPVTVVEIDGQATGTTEVRDNHIVLTLPAALAAGPHGVQVRQGVAMGAPGVQHLAFGSTAGAFIVHPVITKTGNVDDVEVTNVQGLGAAPRSARIRVGVAPAVLRRQTAVLELVTVQLGPDGSGHDVVVQHSVQAADRASDTSRLTFEPTGLAPGQYLVRVRVDGAESPLEEDQAGTPIGPVGAIP
ncbi:DUF4255 domain-containing protein [Microbacterium ureisolvens]|uniref:DUF4255 domain-containing protein n=1 Tax=Microbacterium ureisolvens TaxID=2781186 RepID=UPI00363BA123